MKKKMVGLLVIGMTLSMGIISSASNTQANNTADVKAKFNSSVREEVQSVDITWGSMQFDYNEQEKEWDTQTHQWKSVDQTEAVWVLAADETNFINITNHSSKAVAATLGYKSDSGYQDVVGTFTYNGSPLTAAITMEMPEENRDAKTYGVVFMPSGTLTGAVEDYTKIGTITISLE